MNNMNNRHTSCCGNGQYDRNRGNNCRCGNMPSPGMNQNGGCARDNCHRRNYGCDADSSMHNDPLCGMPIGMGYVPWQQWDKIYDICDALNAGTMFPELNLPFCGCIPRNCGRSKGGTL